MPHGPEKHRSYLMIDDRVSGGELKEFDTVPCKHCGGVIAIVSQGGGKIYQHHRTCERCAGPLCRVCAQRMQATGLCNPLAARLEHAIKIGRWDESYQHEFKILPK